MSVWQQSFVLLWMPGRVSEFTASAL